MAETNGTARLGVWVSALGTGALILGALFVLYSQVSTTYATTNDLKERVERLSAEVVTNRTQITQLCSELTEVETQFRASDQVRNLMHTNDLRVEAMLWHKTYGQEYPVSDPYLPTIAQDQPNACR